MGVLNALSRVATGYDPDARSRANYGHLSQVIGGITSRKKLANAGKEILQRMQQGEKLEGKDFVEIARRHNIRTKEEIDQLFSGLKQSGAMDQLAQQRALSKLQLGKAQRQEAWETTPTSPGMLESLLGPGGTAGPTGMQPAVQPTSGLGQPAPIGGPALPGPTGAPRGQPSPLAGLPSGTMGDLMRSLTMMKDVPKTYGEPRLGLGGGVVQDELSPFGRGKTTQITKPMTGKKARVLKWWDKNGTARQELVAADNFNTREQEIIAAGGRVEKPKKPAYDEATATKRVSDIEVQKARLRANKGLNPLFLQMLRASDPEMAAEIESSLGAGNVEDAIKTLTKEQDWIREKYLPKTGGGKTTPSGITHNFFPGKGLVQVGQ